MEFNAAALSLSLAAYVHFSELISNFEVPIQSLTCHHTVFCTEEKNFSVALSSEILFAVAISVTIFSRSLSWLMPIPIFSRSRYIEML